MDGLLFSRNIEALSFSDPRLCSQVRNAKEKQGMIFIRSRQGPMVPCFEKQGTNVPLHSLYDPVKEGEKLSSVYPDAGFIIFLGLGGGYQILPFLRRGDVNRILILDTDIAHIRSLFSAMDFTPILSDPRVSLFVAPPEQDIPRFILSEYIPLISGTFAAVPLRPRVEMEQPFFSAVSKHIQGAVETVSGDFSVQSHFGRRWFRNILLNIRKAEHTLSRFPAPDKALITAAGPSLEEQIPDIQAMKQAAAKRKEHVALIATDTTLPALMGFGICPDAVISIDCQHISYHHVLKGYPRHVPFILDLASPHRFADLSDRPLFFTSGHPLSRFIAQKWIRFPFVDTSGGNVTHAAVSFADSIGAEEIHLFGADFSYPDGKPYARGTYLFHHFHALQTRFAPEESEFFAFLMRTDVHKVRTGDTFRYSTDSLRKYMNSLIGLSAGLRAELIPHPGKGEPFICPAGRRQERTHAGNRPVSAGKNRPSPFGWETFLSSYAADLRALPQPSAPLAAYFSRLSKKETELWMTLLPLAAAEKRLDTGNRFSPAALLTETKAQACEALGRFIR